VRVLGSTDPDGSTYIWRASTSPGGNPGDTDAALFAGSSGSDADLDGIFALLEYSLGTSDASPDAGLWSIDRDGSGRCLFTFQRAVAADDAALTIEMATTAGGPWAPASAVRVSSTGAGSVVTETWRIDPPAGSSTFFLRLRSTLR
jgi:hypothetical protein